MGRLVATPPPPSPPRRRRSRRNLSLSWQHRPFFRERTDEDDTTTAPHGSTLMGLLFNNSLELTSEATAPQLRTKPKRRSRDSSRPSPLPRSLHFIHLHYKLVYYFALLARAARNESWHNETSPRGMWGIAPLLPEGAWRRNNVWSEYDDSAYKKEVTEEDILK